MRVPRRFEFRFAYRTACVLVVLTCLLSLPLAQENRHALLSFERGEELIYQAEFSRGLLRGVDVAEFHFKSISEHAARGAEDPVVLRLTGDVTNKGLFPRIAGF